MNVTGYIRSIDDKGWKRIDPPPSGSKKLLNVLGVPRDAVTFESWGPEHEQFRDIRQPATAVRDVLSQAGLTDALVFTEWFHDVEFRGEAADRWLR